MEFRLLALSALFCLIAVTGSHVHGSSVSAENYWQSAWPNTPMPKAIQDLTKTGLWKGPSPTGAISPAKVGDNKIDVDVYSAASNEICVPIKLADTENLTTYFFEHNLRPGQKLNLHFTKRSDEFTFLPLKISKSIPFSSNKLPEILNYFGIQAKSAEAEMVKYTLEICESPAIKGEDKYCASSLESMMDFTVSKLGKNIKMLSTEVEKESEKQGKKEYRVEKGVQKAGDRAVVCHKLNYPYAVFYCHKVYPTRAYSVPLVASDGTKSEGLAVCHTKTSSWNRKNAAFVALKVKPGTVPVCHFLATDTLLWAPN